MPMRELLGGIVEFHFRGDARSVGMVLEAYR